MTKYILHGGYMKVDNALNRGFFNEISKGLKEKAKILIICFARKENEYKEIFERDKKNILNNTDSKTLQISSASKDNFIEQLKESDAILIEGGDARQLLETLKQYLDFKEVIEGKVIAGSSAGAYVLSKYFYSNTEDKIFEGFGILPIRTICHYNGEQELINRMDKYPKEFRLIVLKDYEYEIINQ